MALLHRHCRALGSGLQADSGLPARGETPAALGRRCMPAGCVAPRSNTPGILARRALPAGRIAALGATLDFHHGLLAGMTIAVMASIATLAQQGPTFKTGTQVV